MLLSKCQYQCYFSFFWKGIEWNKTHESNDTLAKKVFIKLNKENIVFLLGKRWENNNEDRVIFIITMNRLMFWCL